MFAAQITGPSRIEIVDVPEPALADAASGTKQILFQPELTCLCGSDIPFFLRGDEQPARHSRARKRLPSLMTASR